MFFLNAVVVGESTGGQASVEDVDCDFRQIKVRYVTGLRRGYYKYSESRANCTILLPLSTHHVEVSNKLQYFANQPIKSRL